jgi:hypothetical protein
LTAFFIEISHADESASLTLGVVNAKKLAKKVRRVSASPAAQGNGLANRALPGLAKKIRDGQEDKEIQRNLNSGLKLDLIRTLRK